MSAIEAIPFLSEGKLSGLDITTSELVQSIETLMLGLKNQTAWCAPKAVILPDDGRYMMATLAAVDDPPLLAVKTQRKLGRLQSLYALKVKQAYLNFLLN